jgi:agmatinase
VQSAIIRPWNPVLHVNPFAKYRIADFGDLPVNPLSIQDTFLRIERGIAPLLEAGVRCVCVGGDHSISLPLLRAVAKKHGPVHLIQFDAHNDLWDEYFGSKYSHGTPFRRAFEEGLLIDGGVLQVGLRGQVYGEDDFDFARAHKVKMVTAEELHKKGLPAVQRHLAAFRRKPVYVTLDIDCVDPAFAPGTGTPQVGGFSSIQILELVRALRGLNITGCDLVEVSPPYDSGEITSLLAANLLYELLCVL